MPRPLRKNEAEIVPDGKKVIDYVNLHIYGPILREVQHKEAIKAQNKERQIAQAERERKKELGLS